MATAQEILAGLERFGIRLGLGHLGELTAALGSPEHAVPTLIVAGTNGKGSVASLLASIAGAAGLRAGLYTSPHLETPEERIRLDGAKIPPAALADLLREVLATAASLGHASPTYFEAMTLAAFLHFARHSCDLVVLEVGMGGRLDATNLADAALAVVTAISLDHQEWLGSSVGAIAREKAGVMRPGRTVIVSPQPAEAFTALAEEAGTRGAQLVEVEREVVGMQVRFRGTEGLELSLSTRRHRYELASSLAGRHQAWNVATAVVAAEQFARAGLPEITPAAIAGGVAACRWPGRLEALSQPGSQTTVLLDAAHNPGGCTALAAFLDELDRPFTLLFGALADKDLANMLPALAARARRVVLTRPDSARAADPSFLASLLSPDESVTIEPEIQSALRMALGGEPGLVVACGSIFLIGAVRSLLTRNVNLAFHEGPAAEEGRL
ncbi:MAG: folylpolyglutamate synthase/dihydrofolate synthase family protein [Thermoanaerobaculia bacterium]